MVNLKKWEGIFQSGKSQGILKRLEKSWKISHNTGKLKEFQKKIIFFFNMKCVFLAKMDKIWKLK